MDRASGSRSRAASPKRTAARLYVESLPGQGATFVFELPLADDARLEDRSATPDGSREPAPLTPAPADRAGG